MEAVDRPMLLVTVSVTDNGVGFDKEMAISQRQVGHLGLQLLRGVALLGSSLFFISGLRFLPIAEASATGFVAQWGSDSHLHLLELIEAGKGEEAERFWREHISDGARLALRGVRPGGYYRRR